MKKETNILIKLVKGLIKAFALVIAQIVKIIYLIIKWFNNLNAKLFMKLPRLLRVAIIYLLIGLSIFAFEKPQNKYFLPFISIISLPFNIFLPLL